MSKVMRRGLRSLLSSTVTVIPFLSKESCDSPDGAIIILLHYNALSNPSRQLVADLGRGVSFVHQKYRRVIIGVADRSTYQD